MPPDNDLITSIVSSEPNQKSHDIQNDRGLSTEDAVLEIVRAYKSEKYGLLKLAKLLAIYEKFVEKSIPLDNNLQVIFPIAVDGLLVKQDGTLDLNGTALVDLSQSKQAKNSVKITLILRILKRICSLNSLSSKDLICDLADYGHHHFIGENLDPRLNGLMIFMQDIGVIYVDDYTNPSHCLFEESRICYLRRDLYENVASIFAAAKTVTDQHTVQNIMNVGGDVVDSELIQEIGG